SSTTPPGREGGGSPDPCSRTKAPPGATKVAASAKISPNPGARTSAYGGSANTIPNRRARSPSRPPSRPPLPRPPRPPPTRPPLPPRRDHPPPPLGPQRPHVLPHRRERLARMLDEDGFRSPPRERFQRKRTAAGVKIEHARMVVEQAIRREHREQRFAHAIR